MEIQNLRVLIVDDSAHMRSLIRHMLYQLGIRKMEDASAFHDAIDALSSGTYDMVIVDYTIEPLNGNDFSRYIRWDKDSPCREIPIILMTSHMEADVIHAASNAGVHAILGKPFKGDDLTKKVKDIITNPRPFVRSEKYIGPERRYIRNRA